MSVKLNIPYLCRHRNEIWNPVTRTITIPDEVTEIEISALKYFIQAPVSEGGLGLGFRDIRNVVVGENNTTPLSELLLLLPKFFSLHIKGSLYPNFNDWNFEGLVFTTLKLPAIHKVSLSNFKVRNLDLSETKIKVLEGSAFDHVDIQKLFLPPTLEDVKKSCLYHCEIGEIIFHPESFLKSIAIQSNFGSKLGRISLPKNVDLTNSSFAFSEAEEIVFHPECVIKEIPKRCFEYSGVKYVRLSRSVKEIGDSCFFGSKVKKVDSPEDSELQLIGASCFQGTPLEYFPFTRKVRKIYSSAFANTNINKVILHDGVEEIGSSSFEGTRIEELEIPGSVKSVGSLSFSGCSHLRKVTFLESENGESKLSKLSSSAFDKSDIKTITVPPNIDHVYLSSLPSSVEEVIVTGDTKIYGYLPVGSKLVLNSKSILPNEFYVQDAVKRKPGSVVIQKSTTGFQEGKSEDSQGSVSPLKIISDPNEILKFIEEQKEKEQKENEVLFKDFSLQSEGINLLKVLYMDEVKLRDSIRDLCIMVIGDLKVIPNNLQRIFLELVKTNSKQVEYVVKLYEKYEQEVERIKNECKDENEAKEELRTLFGGLKNDMISFERHRWFFLQKLRDFIDLLVDFVETIAQRNEKEKVFQKNNFNIDQVRERVGQILRVPSLKKPPNDFKLLSESHDTSVGLKSSK
ncbi:MAG: leucine-rich repeat domain-containing protein [Clostridiales bacterium]|jgi:hypothetical protein|nr:leucine-rich repeat domain-containing protein [Clostridiales bacterium]